MSDDEWIHPNAPAGPLGPGPFRSALPLGLNPEFDQWWKPTPLCVVDVSVPITPLGSEARKLAAIAYGEASTRDNGDEIAGIAFAVANRLRAWEKSSVDELLKADPNYTYAVKDGNQRYLKLMKASDSEIDDDKGMSFARDGAIRALAETGTDPSNGAFWWDGVDFQTNPNHPKKKQGFHYGDKSHNIFNVAEVAVHVDLYRKIPKRDGTFEEKKYGSYKYTWLSTAAKGQTIFWIHDPDYLRQDGAKPFK